MLRGDKGYDSNAIRRQVEGKGAMPNIPPKTNRRWKNSFAAALYRNRNAIERMFGRLKDFRRMATRYVRLAENFLAAVCLAGRRQLLVKSPDPRKNGRAGANPDDVASQIGGTEQVGQAMDVSGAALGPVAAMV